MFAEKRPLLSVNQTTMTVAVTDHEKVKIENLLHMKSLKGFHNSYFNIDEFDVHTTIFSHVDEHFTYDTVGEKYDLLKKLMSFNYPYIVYENKDNRFKDNNGRTVNIIRYFYEVAYKGEVFEVCLVKSANFPGVGVREFNQIVSFYATDSEYEGRRNKLQNCTPIETEFMGDDEAQELLYKSTGDHRIFSYHSLGEHLGDIVVETSGASDVVKGEIKTVYKPELDIEALKRILPLRMNSNGRYEFEPGEFFDLIENNKIPQAPFEDAYKLILNKKILKTDSQLYIFLSYMVNSKKTTLDIKKFFMDESTMEARVKVCKEEAEEINEFLGYNLISVNKSSIYI